MSVALHSRLAEIRDKFQKAIGDHNSVRITSDVIDVPGLEDALGLLGLKELSITGLPPSLSGDEHQLSVSGKVELLGLTNVPVKVTLTDAKEKRELEVRAEPLNWTLDQVWKRLPVTAAICQTPPLPAISALQVCSLVLKRPAEKDGSALTINLKTGWRLPFGSETIVTSNDSVQLVRPEKKAGDEPKTEVTLTGSLPLFGGEVTYSCPLQVEDSPVLTGTWSSKDGATLSVPALAETLGIGWHLPDMYATMLDLQISEVKVEIGPKDGPLTISGTSERYGKVLVRINRKENALAMGYELPVPFSLKKAGEVVGSAVGELMSICDVTFSRAGVIYATKEQTLTAHPFRFADEGELKLKEGVTFAGTADLGSCPAFSMLAGWGVDEVALQGYVGKKAEETELRGTIKADLAFPEIPQLKLKVPTVSISAKSLQLEGKLTIPFIGGPLEITGRFTLEPKSMSFSGQLEPPLSVPAVKPIAGATLTLQGASVRIEPSLTSVVFTGTVTIGGVTGPCTVGLIPATGAIVLLDCEFAWLSLAAVAAALVPGVGGKASFLKHVAIEQARLYVCEVAMTRPNGTQDTPGCNCRGTAHLLGWKGKLDVNIEAGKSMSGSIEMDDLNLADGMLKISGVNGQKAMFAVTESGLRANLAVQCLNLISQTAEAKLNKYGVRFMLNLEAGPIKTMIGCTLMKQLAFNAGFKTAFALGLSSVPLIGGFVAKQDPRVELVALIDFGPQRATSATATFSFLGQDIVLTFKDVADILPLQDLPGKILDKAVEEVKKLLPPSPEKILDGVIDGAIDVGEKLLGDTCLTLGITPADLAGRLNKAGRPAKLIGDVLYRGFGLPPSVATRAMSEVLDATGMAEALRNGFGLGAADTAFNLLRDGKVSSDTLKSLGGALGDIAGDGLNRLVAIAEDPMKAVRDAIGGAAGLAEDLIDLGGTIGETVGGWFGHRKRQKQSKPVPPTPEEIANRLLTEISSRESAYPPLERGRLLRDQFGFDPVRAHAVLKGAGLSWPDRANVLRYLWCLHDARVVKILLGSSPGPATSFGQHWIISDWVDGFRKLLTAWQYGPTEAIEVLSAAGIRRSEIARAMQKLFGLDRVDIEKVEALMRLDSKQRAARKLFEKGPRLLSRIEVIRLLEELNADGPTISTLAKQIWDVDEAQVAQLVTRAGYVASPAARAAAEERERRGGKIWRLIDEMQPYARSHGFLGAVPTFLEAHESDPPGLVCDVLLIKPEKARVVDVPLSVLPSPSGKAPQGDGERVSGWQSWAQIFNEVQASARQRGCGAGFPVELRAGRVIRCIFIDAAAVNIQKVQLYHCEEIPTTKPGRLGLPIYTIEKRYSPVVLEGLSLWREVNRSPQGFVGAFPCLEPNLAALLPPEVAERRTVPFAAIYDAKLKDNQDWDVMQVHRDVE